MKRSTPLKRGKPLRAKTRMKQRSDKRKAYRASDEGEAAADYIWLVKHLPCAVCGAPPPSDAHHVICDRFGARKSSDWDVIPLCKKHHQDGPEAIHNGKASWVALHGPDHDYIEATQLQILGEVRDV
jgi:hypothetical protein